MADDLSPVPIQDLRPLAEGRHWTIDQHLEELESLTPVRGELRVIHRGNVLEVAGHAETIVTLCCDRCLQHFNRPLAFRTQELLWLGDAARDAGLSEDDVLESGAQVLDLEADALTESLDPRGSFEPAHWAFEQLSLQLPVVNRCGPECPGPKLRGSGPGEAIDPRWAALKKLAP